MNLNEAVKIEPGKAIAGIVVPETLCCVLYGLPYIREGIDAFISVHGFLKTADGKSLKNAVLPFVHPKEWETVARTLAWSYGEENSRFSVAYIETATIENLMWQPHPLLEFGEYSGDVPSYGIHNVVDYSWISSDHLPPAILPAIIRYPHKFERSLNHRPQPIRRTTFE
jgi:hypothetical protein